MNLTGANFENLIGRKADSIELFPVSEGFFCLPRFPERKGMLLLSKYRNFLRICKADEFYRNHKRHTIGEAELNQFHFSQMQDFNYNIGDTVQFTSLKPYRVIVSGRIKHYISAFGEHVIAKEVESALRKRCKHNGSCKLTVAPQISSHKRLPYH
jgi:hypothetical protein